MVLPALRRDSTWDLASGCRKTAVSAGRMSAAARRRTPRVVTSARRQVLIFIESMGGGRFVIAGVRAGYGEEGLDFLRRKLFHAAQRNSFQAEGADLVAAQAAHLEAEGGEELADLALLAVVHVHVELGRGLVGLRVDQVGTLDLQVLALDHDTAQQLAEAAGGEGLLQRDVVALHDEVRW